MAAGIKDEAIRLVAGLPEGSTWEDLMQAIYQRLVIEKARDDFREGRTMTNAEVRDRYDSQSEHIERSQ